MRLVETHSQSSDSDNSPVSKASNPLPEDVIAPSVASPVPHHMSTPNTPIDPLGGHSEIKEYHFHVYYYQTNATSRSKALALRDDILRLTREGYFHAVPLATFNDVPRGPHPIGSYEVWCPRERFSRTYSYFALNRGELSVLIHPLTREEVKDHSERAVWLGKSFGLDLSQLTEVLDEVPAQYPELGLGYSRKGGERDVDFGREVD